MIFVEIDGGLGNQMFQYAAARALAERHRTGLMLDIGSYQTKRPPGLEIFPRAFKLSNFRIKATVATPQETSAVRDRFRRNPILKAVSGQVRRRWRRMCCGHFIEKTMNYDPVFLKLPDNVCLTGYFQSERYFKPIGPMIREELTFTDPAIALKARQYVDEVRARSPGMPVVSVHVRRGDMSYSVETLRKPEHVPGPPVSLDYIHKAMDRFGPEVSFLVFSDSDEDLDWCKQNVRGPAPQNLHFSYGHSDLEDFAIMSACDHHVISSSSFSWWAAWLNPVAAKKVIAPGVWLDAARYPDHDIRSLVPAEWQLVGPSYRFPSAAAQNDASCI